MTYAILSVVENWARTEASKHNRSPEYKRALLLLTQAIREVTRFH